MASLAEPDSSFRVAAALGVLVSATTGLLVIWFFERWLLKYINPDDELRQKVISLASLRPFGRFWAVRELLDQSVLRGEHSHSSNASNRSNPF